MNLPLLQQKFFSDPEWKEIEKLLADYIEPLIDPDKMDWTQSATQFKAELKARHALYKSLSEFLQSTGIISRPLREIRSTFK